jgi:hypothetical protein
MSFLSLQELIKLLTANIFALLFGAVTTLIAALLTRFIKAFFKQRSLSSLSGEWLEVIPSLNNVGRQYSVGSFYFDKVLNSFRYDGRNYFLKADSCKPFYKWECKVLYAELNDTPKQILYIYKVYDYEQNSSEKYGFGVTYIEIRREACTFRSGFFIDANQDTQIRSYRPVRIKSLERELGIDRKAFDDIDGFHEKVIVAYHKKYGSSP